MNSENEAPKTISYSTENEVPTTIDNNKETEVPKTINNSSVTEAPKANNTNNLNPAPQKNNCYDESKLPKQYKPLSPWGYFLYALLYCIPVIGLICLIIFSFSDSNINRRNFSRSFFCGFLVSLILLVIGFIIVLITGASLDLLDQFSYPI